MARWEVRPCPRTRAGVKVDLPDREVIVRGDRHLQYEKVSEVLTLISEAGFERVGLVTEKRQAEGS